MLLLPIGWIQTRLFRLWDKLFQPILISAFCAENKSTSVAVIFSKISICNTLYILYILLYFHPSILLHFLGSHQIIKSHKRLCIDFTNLRIYHLRNSKFKYDFKTQRWKLYSLLGKKCSTYMSIGTTLKKSFFSLERTVQVVFQCESGKSVN